MEFSSLYAEFFSPVYNYVRCRVAESAAAEDVCSAVFEQALGALNTYEASRGAVAPWLFGIARNAVNHHFRMRRLRSWLPMDLAAEPQDPGGCPIETLIGSES